MTLGRHLDREPRDIRTMKRVEHPGPPGRVSRSRIAGMAPSDTMLAARYPTVGSDQGALSVTEMPRPAPAPGEVLVRVRVSGVNPTDWKSRRSGGNASVAEEIVPNQDGAGEVVAVGDGVDPARVGERVWLWEGQWQRAQGTAAQWIAVPSRQAVALPPEISLELGAGLGIPAITAHRCLPARRRPPGRRHEKKVVFVLLFDVNKDAPAGPIELAAQARYQACDSRQCLLPVRRTATASLRIDPSAAVAAVTIPPGYTLFDPMLRLPGRARARSKGWVRSS